ncbi:sugar ABC transporter substrate-binding protein [Streptomyces tubercidicus]
MISKRFAAATAVALAAALVTACSSTAGNTGGGGTEGKVGIDLPLLTSPFWQAYNNNIPKKASELGVTTLPPVNSNSDAAQQITDINTLLSQGVAGLVVSPLDSAAIVAGLKQAERKKVPVVAVDVAPDKGNVYMVVRANNEAYGQQACRYIGKKVKKGKVVQIMGDLASVNGRERTQAFKDCMAKNYPAVKVLEVPAAWQAETAASKLDSLLTANPDVKGIYMQAGGVYLSPTLQTLKSKHLLFPAGHKRHIVVVSNDGIPQELNAIRQGDIDATVSQPADAYAYYGLYYIKAALAGKKFQPGPTDHNSEIVKLDNGMLEDQLPAPLVTKANVNDQKFWGNSTS